MITNKEKKKKNPINTGNNQNYYVPLMDGYRVGIFTAVMIALCIKGNATTK